MSFSIKSLFVILLTVWIGASWSAPADSIPTIPKTESFHVVDTDRQNPHYYDSATLVAEQQMATVFRYEAWFSGIALILSIIALFLGIWQFFKSLTQSQQERRAHVYIEKVKVNGVHDFGPFSIDSSDAGLNVILPSFEITFKNSGQSPAVNVRHEGFAFPKETAYATEKKTQYWADLAQTMTSITQVPPGGTISTLIEVRGLSENSVANLKNGSDIIYVEGFVKYETLGIKSIMKYRLMRENTYKSTRKAGVIGFPGAHGLLTCQFGNGTEERKSASFLRKLFYSKKKTDQSSTKT